jgi:hypothetical protein
VPLRCRYFGLSSDRVVVEVGALKSYGSRQLEVKVCADADLDGSPRERQVENVPTLRPGLVDEVGVITRDANSLLKDGRSKPHYVTTDFRKDLHGFTLGDLDEAAIGR